MSRDITVASQIYQMVIKYHGSISNKDNFYKWQTTNTTAWIRFRISLISLIYRNSNKPSLLTPYKLVIKPIIKMIVAMDKTILYDDITVVANL